MITFFFLNIIIFMKITLNEKNNQGSKDDEEVDMHLVLHL